MDSPLPLQLPPATSAMNCLEQSLVPIKQTSAELDARLSQFHRATIVLLFLYYFCFITATAEMINPTCSKNVCTLPVKRMRRGVSEEYSGRVLRFRPAIQQEVRATINAWEEIAWHQR